MASKNLCGPCRVLRSGESELGCLDAVVTSLICPWWFGSALDSLLWTRCSLAVCSFPQGDCDTKPVKVETFIFFKLFHGWKLRAVIANVLVNFCI